MYPKITASWARKRAVEHNIEPGRCWQGSNIEKTRSRGLFFSCRACYGRNYSAAGTTTTVLPPLPGSP
jgi:hypothetical protein